jgi:hypothetical protein
MRQQVTPGWHLVSMVWDGDPIDVRGVDPWSADWVNVGDQITIAHPSYPDQRHALDVYRAQEPSGRYVTFAAGELSNLAWAFFVPDEVPAGDLVW